MIPKLSLSYPSIPSEFLVNFGIISSDTNKYSCEETSLDEYYRIHEDLPSTIPTAISLNIAKFHLATMYSNEIQKYCTDSAFAISNNLPSSYSNLIFELLTTTKKPEHLKTVPAQSWRFIGIFQTSENIRKIVEDLITHPNRYCLAHNKLNFTRIIVSNKHQPTMDLNADVVRFIDWDACNWGDPSRDLGQVIGGYFVLWLNSMICHSTIETKVSIQTAAIPLRTILASVNNLIKAYLSEIPQILEKDPDFLLRSMQFAGLEIICQLLESFQNRDENAVNRQLVYFYIASQLLSKPEKLLAIQD